MRKSMMLFTLLCAIPLITNAQKVYENRSEIPKQYKWNLEDIYKNWSEWETGMTQLETKMDEVIKMKGKLKSGSPELLRVLKLNDELNQLAGKVYRYPALMYDLDTRNTEVLAKLQKVQIAYAKFGTATAWINPEILEIPFTTIEKWIKENKEYYAFEFGIKDLFRQQAHVLDADKEKLLSYFSQFSSTPASIYNNITTADIDYPEVMLSTGEKLKATNGNYFLTLSTKKNQEDRRKMFEAHYGTFKKYANTYSSIYEGICQRDWAFAQSRNYKSSVEASLDSYNVPVSVYENLVNTVRSNTSPLKKYNELRKKTLGLSKYYNFDNSITLTDFSKNYPFEQAKEMVIASISPMGKEYATKYNTAIQNGWIDVFENTGKRSGAYSADVYGVHPYMLLNYNGTMEDMFTLAHEMGHTMHSLLSAENQPAALSNYTLFVAEVASTFNEALLLDYLLSKTTDTKERIALIQQAVRNIQGTFYTQVLFADFELSVHKLVEKGEPITADVLVKIAEDLEKEYNGSAIEKDDFIGNIWERIPHFYGTPFYVYQYATCYASSAKLFDDYKNASEKDKPAVMNRLLTLLKSGGNNFPMEQLKTAGVDLSQPEAVKAVIDRMGYLVDMLEKELAKLK